MPATAAVVIPASHRHRSAQLSPLFHFIRQLMRAQWWFMAGESSGMEQWKWCGRVGARAGSIMDGGFRELVLLQMAVEARKWWIPMEKMATPWPWGGFG
ncbi:hypothetical protein V6N11_021047 [Hibiscus sabdariffa]|uniref:Uncharacterized protein n=1 Tax=Hibiscus sabdariffa TaxID=183260 RepID=A0ABR2AAU0_9ROSI